MNKEERIKELELMISNLISELFQLKSEYLEEITEGKSLCNLCYEVRDKAGGFYGECTKCEKKLHWSHVPTVGCYATNERRNLLYFTCGAMR